MYTLPEWCATRRFPLLSGFSLRPLILAAYGFSLTILLMPHGYRSFEWVLAVLGPLRGRVSLLPKLLSTSYNYFV